MAPLRIGIFFQNVQLSDIACIDLLGNCSKEYITVAAQYGFGHLLPHAVDMEFLWISETLEPAFMTPAIHAVPTHTYETAPTDLDILLVGGAPLSSIPAASLEFLKKASVSIEAKGGVIMSTCIGALWLAAAGITEGRKCTTNRGFLPVAQQQHPSTEWLDQRWVIDETPGKVKLWTAGGAGAGVDMLATFAKLKFGEVAVEAAWVPLEFDPTIRGQFYPNTPEKQ